MNSSFRVERRHVMALLAAAPFLSARASMAQSAGDPAQIISGFAQRAIVDILAASISNSEKQQRFRTMFKQDFDIAAIGRFVLGRYSRTISPAELERFATLFEDVIVYTWSRRFSEYKGQTLKVTASEPDGAEGAIVKSTVLGTAGNTFGVDWRLRKRPEGYRVVDVIVEGVSMAITYRQEYTSIIGQSGFPALVQRLEQQIGDLKRQLHA